MNKKNRSAKIADPKTPFKDTFFSETQSIFKKEKFPNNSENIAIEYWNNCRVERIIKRDQANSLSVMLIETEIRELFDWVYHFRYNQENNKIEYCHEDNGIWVPMTENSYQVISDLFLKYKNTIFPIDLVEYYIKCHEIGIFRNPSGNIDLIGGLSHARK